MASSVARHLVILLRMKRISFMKSVHLLDDINPCYSHKSKVFFLIFALLTAKSSSKHVRIPYCYRPICTYQPNRGQRRRASRGANHRLVSYLLLRGGAAIIALQVRFHEGSDRSEEHTSELQSRQYLVCR